MTAAPNDWDQVKPWRKEARGKILAARSALPPTLRQGMTAALMERLHPLLQEAEGPISFYWPFRGEPDLRPLMRALAADGVEIALPVGTRIGEPLTFRPWEPGCPMARGIWDIPIPATDIEILPQTIIAPLVGFDAALYRLGYGGGFFDRTLAARRKPAEVIGIGFAMFQLPTIKPQPHDIPMDRIVTDRSASLIVTAGGTSPVCYAEDADPRYAGEIDLRDLTAALQAISSLVPTERAPLLDFIHWRLGTTISDGHLPAPADLDTFLGRLIPRIQDDGIHAALQALRATLIP
ncbi:5-formyltetrahydrofolate cyclo-ligase [Dongia mobilis]|jgi:5-formyltetrahydrofolate cyclo-ligase|uniref:5-formyltetrahydrofolate cyclo-ligase n=1 Tax=Dongia sp. TaxID=1977262 RepID=UPI0026ED8BFE